MNLIICCTPLQVLIAERIMEKFPREEFFGVMLHTVENKKFNFYSERLREKTSYFFSMKLHNNRLDLLKDIYKLKSFFSRKSFQRVFLANFNELHIQFLLSTIQFQEINTFDDGTANIVKNSLFLQNDPKTIIRKSMNVILGNKYRSEDIRKLIHQHYTLYPSQPNIVSNTVEIQLNIKREINDKKNNKTINVFLGQPVYANEKDNINLAKKVIDNFNIDYYFPHPRETYQLEGVEYIDTPLIIEDYISNIPEQHFKIYTYFSSAVLNLINNKNVELIALRIDTDKSDFIDCYSLFEQVGIPVIDIRE